VRRAYLRAGFGLPVVLSVKGSQRLAGPGWRVRHRAANAAELAVRRDALVCLEGHLRLTAHALEGFPLEVNNA
jgi:hypothetical protein